jgi:hypothetical protein
MVALAGGRLTLLNPRLTAQTTSLYEREFAPRPLI